ncbi:MAG TPA: DUF2586 family protein, partial [Flavisolibacter sp.]|nr:DUF2586 family protein [Flavisolibacter sp.]
ADNQGGKFAIGTAAGWLSKLSVQTNMGRVLEGSVLESAWFPDGVEANAESVKGKLGLIHDRRYIFFRKVPGQTGFFFNDDPTACSVASDYSSISWNRVVNKAHVITANKLIEHLLDDVDTDVNDGSISPAMAAEWEGEVENEIKKQMLNKKEISGVKVLINPDQVNLTTDQIEAEVTIVRRGQAKSFAVKIGYGTNL